MPFIAHAPVWSRYPTVAVALGSTEATLREACTSISRSTIFPNTTLAWRVRQSSQGPATPATKAAKAQYPRKPHIRAAGASPIAKLAETAAATVRNKKTAAKPRASLSRKVRRQIAGRPPRSVVVIAECCRFIQSATGARILRSASAALFANPMLIRTREWLASSHAQRALGAGHGLSTARLCGTNCGTIASHAAIFPRERVR